MRFSDGYYTHQPVVDYVSPEDPQLYGQEAPSAVTPAHLGPDHPSSVSTMPDVDLGIQDIGMSVPMGISAANVAGVYSKIRMGASKLEIQFPGYRSGNRNQQTPGMLGEDQRQALREMQESNEVRFTTHASFGLMGMMGRDERGNFSVYNANQDLMELKRAIDFQADMGGGSVVMHSGEFERPMTDMMMDDETGSVNLGRDKDGRLLVRQAHTQEVDARFELLDDRTSQKMETVQKDRLVAFPVWNKSKENYSGIDRDGNKATIRKGDYVDYEGRKIVDIYDPINGRVPEYNKETGRFKTKMMHFDDFRKEAEEKNEWLKRNYKQKYGIEWYNDPEWYYRKIYPEEQYLHATLETQEGHSRGWALQYGHETQEYVDNLEKIEKALEYYKKLDKAIPEEEKWKIMKQQLAQVGGGAHELIPPDAKNPIEILQKARRQEEKRLEFARQSSVSQEQQAEDTAETRKRLITPIKRLEKHGIRMYAEAGLHAMNRTADPNNPVTIAIENLFPERFGGHLEELKWIIRKSRERMTDLLTKPYIEQGVSRNPVDMDHEKMEKGLLQENPYYKGISKEKAEELAASHIKATLDTGHLNMWRKYWQDDPKLNREQNDKKFRDWYLNQVESLAKEGMVGNVHLADNYGYQDDHLSPGQGNAPVKESVSILKHYGYDKAITVEPGADASTDLSDFHGLMKTWKLFGSNVYGMGMGSPQVPQQFNDIHYGYFGQTKPPSYVFGSYSPSNDWTLWSAVPLE